MGDCQISYQLTEVPMLISIWHTNLVLLIYILISIVILNSMLVSVLNFHASFTEVPMLISSQWAQVQGTKKQELKMQPPRYSIPRLQLPALALQGVCERQPNQAWHGMR